jgi:hypothetical protein
MPDLDPTYALVALATFALMRPFFEVPDAKAKGEAQKRGGYKPNAKFGCLYILLTLPIFGCWWWYAVATDQIMLGVIPSLGLVATLVAQWVERASAEVSS